MNRYSIPVTSVDVTEVIKKSRFITILGHTEGVDAAKRFIQQTKVVYPAARHYCWAFVAGSPVDSQKLGFSDDGEPAGTAGKPILAQLQGSQLGEITAVVIRYSGGIKLGTGGLVKAYGGGVQQALSLLKTKLKIIQHKYVVQCAYAQISMVERVVKSQSGFIVESQYDEEITLTLSLPSEHSEQLVHKLNNLSRGALFIKRLS